MSKKKYSDLQLNVLRFYREYLVFAKSKPEPISTNLKINARAIIEKHRNIPRRNYTYTEFILRQELNKLRQM